MTVICFGGSALKLCMLLIDRLIDFTVAFVVKMFYSNVASFCSSYSLCANKIRPLLIYLLIC